MAAKEAVRTTAATTLPRLKRELRDYERYCLREAKLARKGLVALSKTTKK